MATSMALLDAVNEIVETVGEFPMTGTVASGTGTSIYDRARQFLDRENKRVQSQGWPENTIMCKGIVADATDGTIKSVDDASPANEQLGTTALRVRAAGSDTHRTLVLRVGDGSGTPAGPQLWDANKDTGDFGNGVTVFLDIVYLLDFVDLPVLLQDVIVAKSKMEFQRRIQGNPQLDQALYQEYIQAEVQLDRHRPDTVQPFNVQPMIPGGPSGGAQKKEG